ncbi:MAG: nitrate transporter [Sphingomonadales bacterium]|nr:MAG: nitrate transporter [Sphingomonadales bacterium]
MSLDVVRIGFLPLVDAGLPILARELGFAEAEGLDLQLIRDMSWATVRDRLLYGHTQAAHLIAPLALASSLGLDRPAVPLGVPFVLGLNGNAVTVSMTLARELRLGVRLGDPAEVGRRLVEIAKARGPGRTLRFGVVHRFSSHNYMLQYWLRGSGADMSRDFEIVTIPPPFAADALAAGEIDGVCVGEPWNSVAVARGVGAIVTVTSRIWRRGVEKVLAMRTSVLDEEQELAHRLVRSLYEAGKAFIDSGNLFTNAAILARAEYLDGDAALIARAMSDRIALASGRDPQHLPDFMFQHREAANYPWVSQAAWLYSQMVLCGHTQYSPEGYRTACGVFRPDLYRAALYGSDAALPGANAKLEGSLDQDMGVGTIQGRLILGPDRFFDHRSFDPDTIEAYLVQG